jgi:hypothetical protein
MFLPGDIPPRTVSTLLNLSLFRLIVAMCKLVSFSMGEPEFRRGQRDCWPVSWAAFGVLALGLETLAMVLELTATAAAASDCLWTAMLGRWLLQWVSRVAMSPSRMTKIAARRGGWRVEVWLPLLVRWGRPIVRRYPLPRRNLWRFVAVFLFEFA